MRAGIKMGFNLDDYDKIPCSAKEAYDWMTTGRYASADALIYRVDIQILQYFGINDNWKVDHASATRLISRDWFKLVPKKKEQDRWADADRYAFTEGRNFSEKERDVSTSPTLYIPKPDRFAEVNNLTHELIGILELPSHNYSLAHWQSKFARAIVNLIEREKA
jgi:hypothetical protein